MKTKKEIGTGQGKNFQFFTMLGKIYFFPFWKKARIIFIHMYLLKVFLSEASILYI